MMIPWYQIKLYKGTYDPEILLIILTIPGTHHFWPTYNKAPCKNYDLIPSAFTLLPAGIPGSTFSSSHSSFITDPR
jgi:hypothetical protein